MSSDRLLSRGSRRLVLLLLVVAGLPAVALVWLGLQLVAQDRALAGQRLLEERQAALQAVVHALERRVADAERRIAEGPVPDGMVRVAASGGSLLAEPRERVLWQPARLPADAATGEEPFAAVESLEYGGRLADALPAYQALARDGSPSVQAGALVRIARVHRGAEEWDAALATYRRLATLGDVVVAGAPADLQARRATCAVLDAAGRRDDLAREAGSLRTDLLAGRWALDRPAWELAAADVERWTGVPLDVSQDRRLLSETMDALRAEMNRGPVGASVRRTIRVGDVPVTVLGVGRTDQTTWLALSPALVADWAAEAAADAAVQGRAVVLLDTDGRSAAASTVPDVEPVARAAIVDTGLPWTVALVGGGEAVELVAGRRWLLTAGLAAILLLTAGGSYLLWRVVRREAVVSRLQSEFVAAVSHEFRTPLTSMRHITELLDESDEVPPARRSALYGALGRNVERLHRLVESLLDFSRMEDGRKPYDLQPVDAGDLVRDVVNEFEAEVAARGFAVSIDVVRSAPLAVSADRPALTHAVWNLLDNAVKYSGESRAVGVVVRRTGGSVTLSVTDHGMGIPTGERSEVFERFVRGEQARLLGIKGTGLGLAMVTHIVRAHGGRVSVDSVEGAGSTFTIALPALALEDPVPGVEPVAMLRDVER